MKEKLFLATIPAFCIFGACEANGCGQSNTFTNFPSLGGSIIKVWGLNSNGLAVGSAYLPGDVLSRATLFVDGAAVDLGTLGGTTSRGKAINNLGQIVGEASLAGDTETHAFFYNGTQMLDLGTLGGASSTAVGVNDAGQVAGTSLMPGDFSNQAFLWQNGQLQPLGDLGAGASVAVAINQVGTIVGGSYTVDFEFHSFLYKNGTMTDLGTLGGPNSTVYGINDSDVVTGEADTADGETHAFVFSGGHMTDLGTLGGMWSGGQAINNNGLVTGYSETASHEFHAFLYANGTMTDLGTLGGTDSWPTGINSAGDVSGYATLPDGSSHAVVWKNGVLTDLNTLLPGNSGWQLESAEHINDAGQVAGYGTYHGVFQWFLMTPGVANHAPVAVAGADQTVECPSAVTLDGSQSSDPDGDVLSYEWSYQGTVLGTGPSLNMSFPLGDNVLTLTVTDTCGASNSAQVTVHVVDTTAPRVTTPASRFVAAGLACTATVPDFTVGLVASDNCTAPGQLLITQNPAAGTMVGVGSTRIVLTVKDQSSNVATCTTILTVADLTAPEVQSVGASPSQLSPANDHLIPVTVTVKATDVCSSPVRSRITGITCNEVTSPGEMQITGDLTALLAASRDNPHYDRIYTLTLETGDAVGNKTASQVQVVVPRSAQGPPGSPKFKH